MVRNYYIATYAIIYFIDRIDRGEYCSNARDTPSSRLELVEEIRQINHKVNAALSTPKDSDYWVLDRRNPFKVFLPYRNRLISPERKSGMMTDSDVRIWQITRILETGHYDIFSHERDLFELTEFVLNSGNDISKWGMDAFLTSARGYAIYQVVRNCLTSEHFSSNITRASAARTAAESEQYFYTQIARLEASNQAKRAFQRWENEKAIIEGTPGGGFPRKIYLGTNINRREIGTVSGTGGAGTSGPTPGGPGTSGPTPSGTEHLPAADGQSGTASSESTAAVRNCRKREGPVENWYGDLHYDPKIWETYPAPDKSGFSVAEAHCDRERKLNEQNLGSINALMAASLQGLGPTSDLDQESAEDTLRRIADAINRRISRLTFEKLTEECLINAEDTCPELSDDSVFRSSENITRFIRRERPVILREFSALGAMAEAVKAILGRRSLLESRPPS